ncbi:hypothetical protein [Polymorphospora rubra]|uniref:hypothetical protein n=1 Tax=Polymorphospora rubra TaxID=338584 RepID=UPI0031DE468D
MADYSKHHKMAGKIGGLTRAARQTNEEGRKAAAKTGFMRRFYAQVPAEVTDPAERARLANLALRAHMARLAKRSAELRTKPSRGAR